jgi:hypothetical protein
MIPSGAGRRFRGNVIWTEGGAGGGIAAACGLLAEHPDPEFVIHAFTPPAGRGGIAVDVNAEFGMRCFRPSGCKKRQPPPSIDSIVISPS